MQMWNVSFIALLGFFICSVDYIIKLYLKELVDSDDCPCWLYMNAVRMLLNLFFCGIQNLALRYGHPKDIQRAESRGFDRYGLLDENWIRDAPGSSGYKQVARGRGGRPRGKSQKRVINSAPSGKRSMKQGETLTHFLLQQGMSAPGQKHKRGRRTVRRRPEKKDVAESKLDDLYDNDTFMNAVEEPENSGREEAVAHDFSARNIVGENDDSSNNMDVDSDENVDDDSYHYSKWGATTYDTISHRSTELVDMSEDEADDVGDGQGYDGEDGENLGGDVEFNNYPDRDVEGNEDDDGSESLASGDYSDD